MFDQKPKSTSILKNLPPDRQAEIFERCNLSSTEGGGYKNVLQWLIERGDRVSLGALASFYHWYEMRSAIEVHKVKAEAVDEEYAKPDPGGRTQRLNQIGEHYFTEEAVAEDKPNLFIAVQRLQLAKANLALHQEKFLAAQRNEGLKAIKFCYKESRNYPEIYTRLEAALEDFTLAFYRDNPGKAPLGALPDDAPSAPTDSQSHEPETH